MAEAPSQQLVRAQPPQDSLEAHYQTVVDALAQGEVVPFFGAGVNLCGRPTGTWDPTQKYLPNGGELAAHLAKSITPGPELIDDLARVSQYLSLFRGSAKLYKQLHELFDRDYPPTDLHRFFATLPGTLRQRGCPHPHQLIVTTNYDDVMERAFKGVSQPFDLVTYEAEGDSRGRFWHRSPDDKIRLIKSPNKYRGLSLGERPVILKIHGTVDRLAAATGNEPQDSYVITEDHYIDYLTYMDLSSPLPVALTAQLRNSHVLFLGYSLRDWNLRVILHRIWGGRRLEWKSWAVQSKTDELDRKFWDRHNVEIRTVDLKDYVNGLTAQLEALEALKGRQLERGVSV